MASSIDYDYVFANLDTILGIDLVKRGRRWTMPARINLESHRRRDKTVFYINKSGSITVTEQGGESMNLFDFLIAYSPDCHSPRDVFQKLADPMNCHISVSDFYNSNWKDEEPEARFVDIKYVNRLSDFDHWKDNNLFKYLSSVFGMQNTERAFDMYKTGCLGKERVIYWFSTDCFDICHDNRIQYAENGHRIKDTHAFRKFKTGDGFSHKGYFRPFLERLPYTPIKCMVESEKTAMIASMVLGKGVIWMACGGMNQLGSRLPKNVLLFPDYDEAAINMWRGYGRVIEWWNDPVLKNGLEHNDDIGDAIIRWVDDINMEMMKEWLKK